MNQWTVWLFPINALSIIAAFIFLVKRKYSGTKTMKEWSVEDLLASILSALAYLNCLAGIALLLLNLWTGYVLVAVTVIQVLTMYFIIDPKLRKISGDFEQKQQGYIEELDKMVEWK